MSQSASIFSVTSTILLRSSLSILISLTHTHTHPFNGPFSGITRVSRYQKGKTNLDFTKATDRELQCHQLCGNAEIAGLDIDGLDIAGLDSDERICGQLSELKLQNFIPSRRRCSLRTATATATTTTTTTTEMTASRRQLHQLRRPRRHTLRQMQPQTPPVKCVAWHRARGSRWYPADMRAFARAARTALLLWTRVQCAVATSP